MTKTTTNLLGILITILAGTFFNLMLCNSCNADGSALTLASYPSDATFLIRNGVHFSGATLHLANLLVPCNQEPGDFDNVEIGRAAETHTNQP